MAIELEIQYPGRTKQDAQDPNGNFLDSSVAGAFDGTPAKQEWARDMWAFLERIMAESGIIHSGSPDTQLTTQRYDALVKIARDTWPLWDAAHTYEIGFFAIGSDDSLYQSKVASNLNNNPVSTPAAWKLFNAIAVIDNLLSTSTVDALSANQGKELKGLIDIGISQKITTANSGVDVINDIAFSGGRMTFSDKTGQAIIPAYIKQLDAVWAAGNNAGGRPAAVSLTDTTYHCFAIYSPSGELGDYGFDTSVDALNLLADPNVVAGGYTKKQRVWSIIRADDGAGSQIRGFTKIGKYCYYKSSIQSVGTNLPSNIEQIVTLAVPLGIKTLALVDAFLEITIGTASANLRLYPLSGNDDPVDFFSSQVTAERVSVSARTLGKSAFEVLVEANAQIKIKISTNSGNDTRVGIRGWIDVELEE